MSKVKVWKYPVEIQIEPTKIKVPKGSELMCFGNQMDILVAWFEVPADNDGSSECDVWEIKTAMTGEVWDRSDDCYYFDTIQFHGGNRPQWSPDGKILPFRRLVVHTYVNFRIDDTD